MNFLYYIKCNFLIASIWYTVWSLALSISSQNSEKLTWLQPLIELLYWVSVPVVLQFTGGSPTCDTEKKKKEKIQKNWARWIKTQPVCHVYGRRINKIWLHWKVFCSSICLYNKTAILPTRSAIRTSSATSSYTKRVRRITI